MNTLILMVGLPRSGKSTLARKYVEDHNAAIVNPDAIRLALHGQAFIAEAEPMVWCLAKYMVKHNFLAGHDKVILDATNLTKERRREWRSKHWSLAYYYVDTDIDTCIERAIANNQQELVPVIKRMHIAFESVEESEKISQWREFDAYAKESY